MRTSAVVLAAALVAAAPAALRGDREGPASPAVASPRTPPPSGPAYGTYAWPVRGPVIRPFAAPESPYGSGHRGIDVAAPVGSQVRAAAGGVVAFAGPVAGGLFVSIDHPDGVRTTYSWLSAVSVKAGAHLAAGDVVGRTGPGHPGIEPPHLHFGARFGGAYLDPMLLLEPRSVVGLVHLAPLEPGGGGSG
jgi:murein DD-endopeptidase MepM/ murein hydrolase activator NlpD